MNHSELKNYGWWERYFAIDGGWERAGGRKQSRIFAEHFVAHAGLQAQASFSLLDAGCALGDALALFAQQYPRARLHGIDFSATAIDRCRRDQLAKAAFEVGDLMAIADTYDVIYCSNTLEHFADFDTEARHLMRHCRKLFVMVPFHELQHGKAIAPNPLEHHQHTFERQSFDFLLREGLASRIDCQAFACPGAWGWGAAEHMTQFVKNIARLALGRSWVHPPLQVLYEITAAHKTSTSSLSATGH